MADSTYPADNSDYPIEDWQYEVQNNKTNLGYTEWLEHKREADSV